MVYPNQILNLKLTIHNKLYTTKLLTSALPFDDTFGLDVLWRRRRRWRRLHRSGQRCTGNHLSAHVAARFLLLGSRFRCAIRLDGTIEAVQQYIHFALALFAHVRTDFGRADSVAFVHESSHRAADAVAGSMRLGQN